MPASLEAEDWRDDVAGDEAGVSDNKEGGGDDHDHGD